MSAPPFPELPIGAPIFVRRIEWIALPENRCTGIDFPEPTPATVSDGRADCMGGIEINVRPEHLPEGIPADHTLWAPLVSVSLR